MATSAEVAQARETLSALSEHAQAAMRQMLADVPAPEAIARMSADQITDLYKLIRDRWWMVAEQFGSMAAALGQAQASMMLDSIGRRTPTLRPTQGIRDEKAASVALTYALGQDDWAGALLAQIDGHLMDANAEAIIDVAEDAQAEVLWQPSGLTTCTYCLRRASYGSYSSFRTQAQRQGFETKPHAHCVVPGTLIHGPALRVGVRREYDGDVVTVRTALGHDLTVTPNHPVLTRRGWVPAELLHEGDDLLAATPVQRDVFGGPDEDDAPALAEDVFRALAMSPGVVAVSVPGAAKQFHGDGMDSEVEIVDTYGLLGDEVQSGFGEPFAEPEFASASPLDASDGLPLDGGSAGEFGRERQRPPSNRGVGGGCLGGAFCGTHPDCTCTTRGGPVANGDPLGHKLPSYGGPANAKGRGDGEFAFASEVAIDHRVVQVEAVPSRGDAGLRQGAEDGGHADAEGLGDGGDAFAGEKPGDRVFREMELGGHAELDSVIATVVTKYCGPVYNFTTDDGWYFANSIVTHNCDCRVVIVVEDSDWPDDYHPAEYGATVAKREREAEQNAYDRKLDGHKTPGPKTRQSVRRDRSAQAWADRQRITAERDAAKKRLTRAREAGDDAAATAAQEVLDRTAAERARLNGTAE